MATPHRHPLLHLISLRWIESSRCSTVLPRDWGLTLTGSSALQVARFAGIVLILASTRAEELSPKPGLPPLRYDQAIYPMPNYLAGEKWGTEGQQITQMQSPLSPSESAARIVLPVGFEAKLLGIGTRDCKAHYNGVG